jgi:ankyrin repeat protein
MVKGRTARRQRQSAGRRETDDTDFTYAVREHTMETINQMISADESIVNKVTIFRKTPLSVAIRMNYLDVASLLIEHGADVNKYSDGNVHLNIAASAGNVDMVRLLLDSGADVNMKGTLNATPLLVAMSSGNMELIRLLLDHGADTNVIDIYKKTPLMVAIEMGNLESVQLVVEHGANVNPAVTSTNPTPLHFAVQAGNVEIAQFLLEHGADVTKTLMGHTPFSSALERENVNMSRMFLEHGVDVNNLPDGQIPLRTEAYAGRLANVRLLIEFGADVNKGIGQITPLRAAIMKKRVEVARFLVNAGATITPADERVAGPDLMRQITTPQAPPAPPAKWKGYAKSSIDTFEYMLFHSAPDSLSSFSRCPVCLGEGNRDTGCNYMNHVCDHSHYRNEELYNKYRTPDGKTWWCAVCGRICNGHTHYKLAAHDARPPGLNEGGPLYGTTCSPGGGNVEEKIARFREMLDTYATLQDHIDTITRKDALDLVTSRMWDAPLHLTAADRDVIATIITNKSFGIDRAVFSNNSAPAPVAAPTATAPPGSFEAPEVFVGENIVGSYDEIPVIRFKHKNASGVMHTHELVVGVATLMHYIHSRSSLTGYKCFDGHCEGLLWPEEIELAFEHDLIKPSITDDHKAKLAEYKQRFYAAYAPAGGGRRRASRKRKAQRKLQRKRMTRRN